MGRRLRYWIRPVAAVERRPKWGCCNRRLLALTDDGWKFIFKDNHQTKTKICDSKQQPHADKSPEPPPTERIQYSAKKDDSKNCRLNFAESTGFEPVDTLRYRQFSKLLVSATHPTLRSAVTLKRCAKVTLFRNKTKIIAIKISLSLLRCPFWGVMMSVLVHYLAMFRNSSIAIGISPSMRNTNFFGSTVLPR